MTIKIDVPGVGEVNVEGAAQEDTLQQILAAVGKSDKTKRKEETDRARVDKASLDAKKKETDATKGKTSLLDKYIERAKKEQEMYKGTSINLLRLKEAALATSKGLADMVVTVASTTASIFASMITTYDQLAKDPIDAGKGILQTGINVMTTIAKIGVDVLTAVGKAVVGWVPFVGSGLADIVGEFGHLANVVIDVANQIATAANEVLSKEFQKRANQLAQFSGIFASFAGGMLDMAMYANQSGVGIVNFTASVASAREYITAMGLDAGTATRLLAKNMGALGTTVGAGGKKVRDELFALGYDYQAQGKVMAQYMSRLRALGVDLHKIAPETLARQTEQYAKNLKVISDITGQDAAKLMDQARDEAQRGALMTKLTVDQTRAFHNAYATLAAMPGQQGPKLQAALAQLLAGGVVTDPVIAGNRIIMDMLKQTAAQISAGNINMVTATQRNLAHAANAYRIAGDSATDFATLMNPTGTSAVAQGMAVFGNALRQYRYDPSAAEASMEAAGKQASISDGLTGTYVGLVNTMTSFQNQMEGIAGEALPAYTAAMMSAKEMTFKIVNAGLDMITGKTGIIETIKNLIGSSGGGQGGRKADVIYPGLSGLLSAVDTEALESTTHKSKGLSSAKESSYDTSFLPWAEGGVASGPVAGYGAILHGTEAVVPLPDNKTIPVSLKTELKPTDPAKAETAVPTNIDRSSLSNLTSVINNQTGILNDILGAMNKNNNLTSGILQASM